ncbi:UPF0496 protein [Musa troglodytarum]|uniref:UPF0496 protein n=1 Tax=Musa troglodytarum TaxID=320322 RepID=A0A9E7F074_9LILI|nr:UPF0496 protein [Musa troglodytarum]
MDGGGEEGEPLQTDALVKMDKIVEGEELRSLLIPDAKDLPSIPPSAVESNFVRYYAAVGLAPSHAALREEGGVTAVNFNVGKSDRSEMKVTGKRKRNAQHFDAKTSLCKVCANGKEFIVRCCVKGSLLEEEGGKDKEDNAAITVRWRRVGRKEESPAFLRVPRLRPVVVGTLQPPLPVPFKKAPACLPLPADSASLQVRASSLEEKAMRWKRMHSSSSKSKSKSSNSLAAGGQLSMARNSNHSRSPLNVNEEYNKTLRTKSFLDMCSKVHQQLRRTVSSIASSSSEDGGSDDDDGGATEELKLDSSPRSESSPLSYADLPDFLLEPSQESLVAAMAATDDRSAHLEVNSLLLEFFDVTLEACTACTNLLASINRARVHHRSIRHLLDKLSFACSDGSDCTAFDRLASLVNTENPLHPQNLAHFHSAQSEYTRLMQRLTVAHRRILRRARLSRLTRKATGILTISTCSIAMAVALVIAVHTVIGVGVVVAIAPAIMTTAPLAAMSWARAGKARYLEKLGAQVDSAAKGAYIVGRDLDTMSRMVRRVHDEVEHERDVARMVLRDRERQLVREAAREVESGMAGMVEQLKELEEHVYLCLITINRSRRMVAQEMMGANAVPSPAAAETMP